LSKEKKITTELKSSYKRLKGVFIVGLDDDLAEIEIKSGSANIVADDKFPAKIIAANDNLSWRDVAWEMDRDIDDNSITITIETSATNKIHVNFIVE